MAYRNFAFIAALTVAIALLSLLPLENATIQVIGMLGIPLILLGLAAGVSGVLLTLVKHRREWPLLTMSAAFVGICLLFMLGEGLPGEQYRRYKAWLDAGTYLSLLIIVLLSGRWLFFTRRRERKRRERP